MAITIRKIACPEPPVGADLMKTGQTTSYRTSDDGDIEAGRATDFLTLEYNNPFGNTNRFTKTDGTAGTIGVVQWIIDWSTYDTVAGTVNGFVNYFWTLGTFNWNDAIDFCNAYSLSGFSNCRLANVAELFRLLNFESGGVNYAPILNSNASLTTWTSTTLPVSSGFAFGSGLSDNRVVYYSKTDSYFALPVRTFTVNGTTLT